MNKSEFSVEILETYKDYKPLINVTAVTRKLIDNIPPKYLIGLRRIVITNLSGLPRRELRKKVKARKRKFSITEVCGFYHHRTGNSSAWIEIFVDQMTVLELGFYQKIPFLRELAVAEVLYHELGHHIHTVLHPEYREREDVADEWQIKLERYYVRKKYWYLLPFLWLLVMLSQSRLFKYYEDKVIEDLK